MRKKNGFTTKETLVIACLSLLIIAIFGLVIYANMNAPKKESEKKEDTPTPVTPEPEEPEEEEIIDVTSILNCSSIPSENSKKNVFFEITFDSTNAAITQWNVSTLENYDEPLTEEELNEKVSAIENAGNTTTCTNNSISTNLNVSCTLNEVGIDQYIQELGTTQSKEEITQTLQSNGLSIDGEQVLFSCS